MTSRDFCFWLQGFFEIGEFPDLHEGQVDCIKRHLNMVFAHEIDPSFSNEEKLNMLHNLGLPKDSFSDDSKMIRC